MRVSVRMTGAGVRVGRGLRRKTPEAAGSKHFALENDHSGSRLRAAIYIYRLSEVAELV